MWMKRHVLFKWMFVTRLNTHTSLCALRLGGGAVLGELLRGPRGRLLHRRQQRLLFAKRLLVLPHLNSVRQVLFLCLFADKETAKKSSVNCPTSAIKWRGQDSNLRSGSKPAPVNQLLPKL